MAVPLTPTGARCPTGVGHILSECPLSCVTRFSRLTTDGGFAEASRYDCEPGPVHERISVTYSGAWGCRARLLRLCHQLLGYLARVQTSRACHFRLALVRKSSRLHSTRRQARLSTPGSPTSAKSWTSFLQNSQTRRYEVNSEVEGAAVCASQRNCRTRSVTTVFCISTADVLILRFKVLETSVVCLQAPRAHPGRISELDQRERKAGSHQVGATTVQDSGGAAW